MEKNACGILSYAGLARDTLLSLAKAAFAQSQPPAPKRFDAFLPLFPEELVQNMDFIGVTDARGAKVAQSGFSIDPAEYHRKLSAQLPELYQEDNYSRNFDYEGRFVGRGVFAVDRAWVDHFPQYQPFMGEKLSIYLIGGGFQAVAVPESVYPRGGGVLGEVEQRLQIAQRVELFLQYAKTRLAAGEPYDADAFAADYLRVARITALTFTQAELGRILQDMSIVKSMQSDTASVGLYTENARRAERVSQYVPMRYACDLFAVEAVDKHTARLAQLHNADADFVSDLWIPYQDFCTYVDRRTMTLDVRALCEGYQIAPRYDPETLGGRYPEAVRVATVKDRDLRIMGGEVINNPAYGNGMGPQGTIGRQVYIADSREMIRQRKIMLEEVAIAVENVTLTTPQYRKCLMLAILQEHKGRLVDAMYRRETALAQINPETQVYQKAHQLLSERVEKLTEVVTREARQSGMSQMSGYDADIDYLRRKQLDREGEADTAATGKPIAFARDAQREQSIESGYAMRSQLVRMMYNETALPEPPAEQTVGADDSEDDAHVEHLPPISLHGLKVPAVTAKDDALKPGAHTAAGITATPRADAQTVPGALKPLPTKPITYAPQSEPPEYRPEQKASVFRLQPAVQPRPAEPLAPGNINVTPTAAQTSALRGAAEKSQITPSAQAEPEWNAAPKAAEARAQAGTAQQSATSDGAGKPDAASMPDIAGSPHSTGMPEHAGTPDAASMPDIASSPHNTGMPEQAGKPDNTNIPDSAGTPDSADTSDNADTPEHEGTPDNAHIPESADTLDTAAAPDGADASVNRVKPDTVPVTQDEKPDVTGSTTQSATVAYGSFAQTPDGEPTAEDAPDPAKLPRVKRVSLRELTDRIGAEPVTPPQVAEPSPTQDAPTTPAPALAPEESQPEKPKLAYILRRGSETTASKSFSRMSDMLNKRGK